MTLFEQATTLSQATICAGLCIMVAFKYNRGESRYRLIPSLCAFGIASMAGQQWMSILGRILMYGDWPIVSFFNTGILAIFLILVIRARGNVAKIWQMPGTWNGHERRSHPR